MPTAWEAPGNNELLAFGPAGGKGPVGNGNGGIAPGMDCVVPGPVPAQAFISAVPRGADGLTPNTWSLPQPTGAAPVNAPGTKFKLADGAVAGTERSGGTAGKPPRPLAMPETWFGCIPAALLTPSNGMSMGGVGIPSGGGPSGLVIGSIGLGGGGGGVNNFCTALASLTGGAADILPNSSCTKTLSCFSNAFSRRRSRAVLNTIEILLRSGGIKSLYWALSGGHRFMTGLVLPPLPSGVSSANDGVSASMTNCRPSDVQKHHSDALGHGNIRAEYRASDRCCTQRRARTSSSCLWHRNISSRTP